MKVAFLDRDGVINKEVGYLHTVAEFEYTENCIIGLRALSSLGFKLIVVTNQAGIARGFYTNEEYRLLAEWITSDLKANNVELLDTFYCPHHPDGKVASLSYACSCRKPQPGMFLKARDKFGIDMSNSIVIGDKYTDILAGRAAGVGQAFLVSSGHQLPVGIQSKVPVLSNVNDVAIRLSGAA